MASAEVTIVLPALNESGNLRALVPALLRLPVTQIVVVDDASADDTAGVMESLTDPRLTYLRNDTRLGLACSVLQGIRRARGTHVLVRDSDLGHSLDDTRRLVEAAARGADFCVASRYLGGPGPVRRTNDLWSRALNRFLRRRLGPITDWTNGFFLLRRSLLDELPKGWIFRGRGEYSIRLYRALVKKTRAQEIPTATAPRGAGRSTTSTWKHGAAYLSAVCEREPRREIQPGSALRAAVKKWRRGEGLAQSGHTRLGYRARKTLLENFRPVAPVLDLGCGNGAFVRGIFPELAALDGIDQSPDQARAARETGYRATWAADLHQPLPVLPESYRTVLCFESLQYLPWERLPSLFREIRGQCARSAELHCLIPPRYSLLHRVRAALGLGKADYRCHHDLALLTAAAAEGGWRYHRAAEVAYGSRNVRPLDVARPRRWSASALVSFRSD